MARYLSAQWFADVAAALDGRAATGPSGVRLVLQQIVTGTPDGDIAYALCLDEGTVSVRTGTEPAADVTITEDYDTAVALHRGDVTLQEAFMHGRVKVAGNITALLTHHDVLAAVEPLPAAARAATTY